MVVCSSLKRAVTSAFIWRCRDGSSGKGYLLALNASQICTCKVHIRPRHDMLVLGLLLTSLQAHKRGLDAATAGSDHSCLQRT